ncbi:MAG: hypothetical protein BWY52_02354 [Chloroflexi bacterium ADurb.Bin325]|nr:MAG: hypothetical protein BWY52_02354 [Chloroflexi bacterium ADurb.Bin325]
MKADLSRREGVYLALLLLCGVGAIAPLLQPGYFWGAHDARHDVYFIFQYAKSAAEGIWFPRWSPDWTFGYGYPFFIVYGPLATFVGVLFHQFLGLGYEASVKAVLALSIIGSGLAMYGFVRSWLGRRAGLVAGVAYMVIPYHLVDVYVRAAMAEAVALTFLPLALWGFRAATLRPRLAAVCGAALAFAAIMWTSNLAALLFTPPLALYVAFLLSDRLRGAGRTLAGRLVALARGAAAPALAGLLGLALSAAFFVPAIVEQAYINRTQWFGEYYDPTQHFVYFWQLFDPSWGFGISQPGPVEAAQGGLSFQLGLAATLLSAGAVAWSAARWLKTRRLSAGRLDAGGDTGHFRDSSDPAARRRFREVVFWALWAAVSVFLTLDISRLAWQHVPIVPYAQFPWRYLMLAILPLSILPGVLVADPAPASPRPEARSAVALWPTLVLAALLMASSAPYLKVEMREPTREQGPVSMAALMRFQRTSDEMTGVTAWVDPRHRPTWSDMADLWVQGAEVTTRVDYSQVPQNESLAVNSEDMGTAHEQVFFYTNETGRSITFNRFWYPGWTAWLLDGKDGRPVERIPVEREAGPLARIVVPVPQGQGYILLRFEDTPLRAAAKWTTVAAAALLVILAGVAVIRT